MKLLHVLLCLVLIPVTAGCASAPVSTMSFDVTFDEIDTSQDGVVSLDEFIQRFPKADAAPFSAADADKDGSIYPDEWYQFREKQGYINQ